MNWSAQKAYMCCLSCRAWGKVKQVKEHIAASKTGPRVGKAISVILDLDDETIKEWFLIS